VADLDPELAALREAGAGNAPLVTLQPREARERVVAGNRLCSAGPDVEVRDELVGAVPVRIYGPPDAATVLVYAHGGGWVTGDLDYSDELCRFLAADAGCRVVSVDYRLAPEHRFPAGLDDVRSVVSRALASSSDAPVGVAGDSAGGNLAAVIAQEERARLAFSVLLYPSVDHDFTRPSYRDATRAFPISGRDMEWFFDLYATAAERDLPAVSPLREQDLGGLPPTHVVVAGHDPLHDEGVEYAAALAAAGVPVSVAEHPELCHGFLRFTAASAAARAARDQVVARAAEMARDPESGGNHDYDAPQPAVLRRVPLSDSPGESG
jgi:acetyl esterase